MQLKELEVKDLTAVSEWLHNMNEKDEHFVAWLASDENTIYEQIWTLTQFKDPLAYIAWDDDRIIGFLGLLPFFDQKLCRLLGPFASENPKEVMEGLWEKASLTVQVHFDAVKVASFRANTELVEFCERHQFHLYNIEKTLFLDTSSYSPKGLDAAKVVDVTEEDREAIDALHPNAAYYTTKEMMTNAHQPGNKLWAYQHDGKLVGYLYFETVLPGREGEICFINVDTEVRNQKIGSTLIDHALQHAFMVEELDAVTISVRTTNEGAEKLYHQFDFRELNTIYAYEKLFQEPILQNPFH
ncbi:GNAT family N-acetyltransferase [Thalassobacillus hwangdonensis]